MLTINVPKVELFDEGTGTFIDSPSTLLLLEHSLASLSKWEAIHEKPFLNGVTKTTSETQSYIACMNLAPVPNESVYAHVQNEDIKLIAAYIESKQTATWFTPDPHAKPSTEVITAEVIHYWMIAHNIPPQYEYWHLEKLLTLIKVCNEKNKPARKSKMAPREQASSRTMLNAQRKAQMGTNG